MSASQAKRATSALERVLAARTGSEEREGQRHMVEAVAAAVEEGKCLVVKAGTGTGKSLAYLVPLMVSGKRAVVATATKTLQDQLIDRDLPAIQEVLGDDITIAVLKGRSNYVCRQKLDELGHGVQDEFGDTDSGERNAGERNAKDKRSMADEVRDLVAWSATTVSGDRAELDFEPRARAWSQVSVGADQCPGATQCPFGSTCFSENARAKAALADLIIVNTHLYASHIASGGFVLPDHDVVVFDEAHEVEDTFSESLGRTVHPGGIRSVARNARSVLFGAKAQTEPADAFERTADALENALAPLVDQRLDAPFTDDLGNACARVVEAALALDRALGAVEVKESEQPQLQRLRKAAVGAAGDIDTARSPGADRVRWVEGPMHRPALRCAPLDLAPIMSSAVWSTVHAAILTSATIPVGLPARLGLPAAKVIELDVGSPFPYRDLGLLYCAKHLPDPRKPGAEAALHDELEHLIVAAGGRTLALFTSRRALTAAVTELRTRIGTPVLAQDDLPKPALIDTFRSDPKTSLFATMGFWQGVDVPGDSLVLVTIDRLPFARPDDPLLAARRERAGDAAFTTIDLPRAGMLLAQGAGRLIRSSTDRGVVAVLDSRLANASYRGTLLDGVPPLRRTIDRDEVAAFLETLRT